MSPSYPGSAQLAHNLTLWTSSLSSGVTSQCNTSHHITSYTSAYLLVLVMSLNPRLVSVHDDFGERHESEAFLYCWLQLREFFGPMEVKEGCKEEETRRRDKELEC